MSDVNELDFPLPVVAEVAQLGFQVIIDPVLDKQLVSCNGIDCMDCPIHQYTENHSDCIEVVSYIREHQLPSLLITNPEVLV